MASAPNVVPIDGERLNARIKRSYSRVDSRLGLGRAVAEDYFRNAPARMGWGTPSLAEATDYDMVRLSYDYWLLLTLYRNHWLSARIVDIPANDMVRAWPRLTSEIDPDDLKKIDKVIRITETKNKLNETIKFARLFGGAGALIIIKGQEHMLEEPLDLRTIELNSYRGLIPFDRWSGVYPDMELSVDYNNPRMFNLPKFYEVRGPKNAVNFKVHASRILRFVGPAMPTPEREAQSYWGISEIERAYEQIRMFDNMSWNILSLSFRANILSMKDPELRQSLSGLGMNQAALQRYYSTMQGINELLSNQSMLVLGKDGEMGSTQYAFTGMSDVLQEFRLAVCGAVGMPETRLFGSTKTGLAQTNDADEKLYEDRIAMDQEQGMRPQLDVLYPVICMSELGYIPDDLDLIFPSIRVLDDKEKSDLATSIGTNIVNLTGAGIIDKVMAMKEVKQSADITGIGTNITDDDIKKAEQAQKLMASVGLNPETGEEEPGGEPAEKEPAKSGKTLAERLRKFRKLPEGKLAPIVRPRHDSDSSDLARMDFAGIPVAIEFQSGERRRLLNSSGEIVYDRLLQFPYGFIEGTLGSDGDEIDVILGPNQNPEFAYVMNMIDLGRDVDQREDENKVGLGFNSAIEAQQAFLTMYPEAFYGGMEMMAMPRFERWLADHVMGGSGFAGDAFEETKHPRASSGSTAGQFVAKGGGSSAASQAAQPGENPGESQAFRGAKKSTGAKGSIVTSPRDFVRAPQVEINPNPKSTDTSKFRPAKTKRDENGKWLAGDKVPGGWTNVLVNPDPKADVEMVGTNMYGKPVRKYSAGFYEKQKELRKKWPKWAQDAKIPGPWIDIKLAPGPDSHVLATGVDTVGVRKPLYNPDFLRQRHEEKHARVKELDSKIDGIYKRIEKDTRASDEELSQTAQCADLILKYGLRPGGTGVQRGSVKSHGALDLEAKHVVRDGRNGNVHLRFIGKKGQKNEFLIDDPKTAKWLIEAKENANRPESKDWQSWDGFLFPWIRKHHFDQYVREVGADKTKDFRTRVGTKLAGQAIEDIAPPKTAKEFKQKREAVGDIVSQKLCNTRAVALSAYINRELFSDWAAGLPKAEQAKIKW